MTKKITHKIFNQLNIGDTIIAIKNLRLESNGKEAITKGKRYEIIDLIEHDEKGCCWIVVFDNLGNEHHIRVNLGIFNFPTLRKEKLKNL